jgi:hypothetical protein
MEQMPDVELWKELKRSILDKHYDFICPVLYVMAMNGQITNKQYQRALDTLRPIARAKRRSLKNTPLWLPQSPKRIEFINRQIRNAQRRARRAAGRHK